MGYLQKEKNTTVIELYNMFSRYRWQTYIFYRSAETVDVALMMATAAMAAAAMTTARAIPATRTARAPAEGHAPHSWDRGGGDEGGDRGGGREDRGMDWGGRGAGDWGTSLLLGLLLLLILRGETPLQILPEEVIFHIY